MNKLIPFLLIIVIGLSGCNAILNEIPCKLNTQIVYSNGEFILQPVFCDITKDCADTLINYINNAQTSIHIMIYSLTEDKITQAIINAHKRGIEIKIIADNTQYRNKNMKEKIDSLKNENISVNIMEVAGYGIMHNKIAIIDGTIIITGSFNYTENADKRSKENLMIVIDKTGELAAKYEEYFGILWGE